MWSWFGLGAVVSKGHSGAPPANVRGGATSGDTNSAPREDDGARMARAKVVAQFCGQNAHRREVYIGEISTVRRVDS
jgi:hypothetical protein